MREDQEFRKFDAQQRMAERHGSVGSNFEDGITIKQPVKPKASETFLEDLDSVRSGLNYPKLQIQEPITKKPNRVKPKKNICSEGAAPELKPKNQSSIPSNLSERRFRDLIFLFENALRIMIADKRLPSKSIPEEVSTRIVLDSFRSKNYTHAYQFLLRPPYVGLGMCLQLIAKNITNKTAFSSNGSNIQAESVDTSFDHFINLDITNDILLDITSENLIIEIKNLFDSSNILLVGTTAMIDYITDIATLIKFLQFGIIPNDNNPHEKKYAGILYRIKYDLNTLNKYPKYQYLTQIVKNLEKGIQERNKAISKETKLASEQRIKDAAELSQKAKKLKSSTKKTESKLDSLGQDYYDFLKEDLSLEFKAHEGDKDLVYFLENLLESREIKLVASDYFLPIAKRTIILLKYLQFGSSPSNQKINEKQYYDLMRNILDGTTKYTDYPLYIGLLQEIKAAYQKIQETQKSNQIKRAIEILTQSESGTPLDQNTAKLIRYYGGPNPPRFLHNLKQFPGDDLTLIERFRIILDSKKRKPKIKLDESNDDKVTRLNVKKSRVAEILNQLEGGNVVFTDEETLRYARSFTNSKNRKPNWIMGQREKESDAKSLLERFEKFQHLKLTIKQQ